MRFSAPKKEFSNFSMHDNELEALPPRFLIFRSGVGQEICISNNFPDDANAKCHNLNTTI